MLKLGGCPSLEIAEIKLPQLIHRLLLLTRINHFRRLARTQQRTCVNALYRRIFASGSQLPELRAALLTERRIAAANVTPLQIGLCQTVP